MSTFTMSTIRQRLLKFDLAGLGIPFLVLLIMAMLVVPLPALLLDVFFTFNIYEGFIFWTQFRVENNKCRVSLGELFN